MCISLWTPNIGNVYFAACRVAEDYWRASFWLGKSWLICFCFWSFLLLLFFLFSLALSWKCCMKWKEVLSSLRGQCVYIGWRLENIKPLIYKLSKYCFKMRPIEHRNLVWHFCEVVLWNRSVCKRNSSSPLFMFINGQFFISECCRCYLFDQIKNIFVLFGFETQKIWHCLSKIALSKWDLCRIKGSFWVTI